MKNKCCFCKKALTATEVGVLKEKITERKERSRKHIEKEKMKIEELKQKKQRLKKKKKEIQEFNKLSLEIKELRASLSKGNEKLLEVNDKLGSLNADIEKSNETLVNLKAAMDISRQLQQIEQNLEIKENELKNFEKEFQASQLQSSQNNEVLEEDYFLNTNEQDLHRESKRINDSIKETEQKRQSLQKIIADLEKDKARDETTVTALIERNKVQGGSDSELKMLDDTKKELMRGIAEKKEQLKALALDKNVLGSNLEKIQNKLKEVEKDKIEKKGLIEYLLPNFIKKMEMWNTLNTKRGKKSQNYEMTKNRLQTEINEIKDKILSVEKFLAEKRNELSQKANSFQLIEKNITLKEKERDFLAISKEYEKNQTICENQRKESVEASKIKLKLDSEKVNLIEKKKWLSTLAESFEKEFEEAVKNDKIETEYMEAKVQIELQRNIVKDLESNQKALERALLQYHKTKMDEINKIIADTWRDIYSGGDIKKIQIISDDEGSATGKKTSKSYNYRLVCTTFSGKELEMKGRCSMGQKVLASVVIRLALAEAFGVNCGILTLDEPTTNLDTDNKKKLAKQLCSLIKSRENNDYFQLIIITHDKDFMQELSEYSTEYYKVYKDEKSFSRISKESIEN